MNTDQLHMLSPYIAPDDVSLDKNTFLQTIADRIYDDLVIPNRAQELGLELPRMLVLSTGHISEHTNGLLCMRTDDVPQAFEKRCWGDGELVGWIIPIVDDEPFPSTCPAELLAIRQLADGVGATWIMLDRDANIVDGLQTWEW